MRERVLTAQSHEMDALAQIRAVPEVVPPRAVDAGERHRPLGVDDSALAGRLYERGTAIRRELPDVRSVVAAQNRLPPLDELAVLLLDDGGVARQRPANLEVLPFDDPLRAGNLASDDRTVDRLVGLPGKEPRRNQAVDAVAHEQVVLEAHEEARLARIALAPGSPAELQVHARALVAVGADDVQAAKRGHAIVVGRGPAAEADVRAATGHVRRDGDGPDLAGARDDERFLGIVLRVQHFAAHAGVTQPRRQAFRLRDRGRANQHGTSGGMRTRDFEDEGAILRLTMREDQILAIDCAPSLDESE